MKLSIIIPIYNKAEYVEYCFKNIIGQSLDNYEIICIDDGSTDKSRQIIEKFSFNDSRIKLITQNNQGAGAARNSGIKVAKGEYVAFMDADDYYPFADVLQKLYNTAVAHNALICGGSFLIWDGVKTVNEFKGDTSGNTFTEEGWINFRDYQYDYAFYRFIYKREFLLNNNILFPNYRRYQDPPFMLRAFSVAEKFYAIPLATYCYRLSKNPVGWTADKVYDLLCGIEDNLIYSSEHGYKKVHFLNYRRLCNDFKDIIINTALNGDSEGKILKKLISVQSVANKDILSEYGVVIEETVLSKPLSELVSELSKLSVQVKKEGWFINKKVFRLYTWPVRLVGKKMRTLKHKKRQ